MLSDDLLVHSRVTSALGELGPGLRLVRGEDPPEPPLQLLLVDLNRSAADRLEWLRQVAPQLGAAEVICFGPHTDMAEMSQRARAAGADRCVANSRLGAEVGGWLRRRRAAQPGERAE